MLYFQIHEDGSSDAFSADNRDEQVMVFDVHTGCTRTYGIGYIDEAVDGLRIEAAKEEILRAISSHPKCINVYYAQEPHSVGVYVNDVEHEIPGMIILWCEINNGDMYMVGRWEWANRGGSAEVRHLCHSHEHVEQTAYDIVNSIRRSTGVNI